LDVQRHLIDDPLPFGVDLSPVIKAITAASPDATCPVPRRLTVNEASDALFAGDYCRVPLATPRGTPVDRSSAVLDLPTASVAEFKRDRAKPPIAYLRFDLPTAMSVQYYALPPRPTRDPIAVDPIVAAYFTPSRILVAGKAEACFMIDLGNAD